MTGRKSDVADRIDHRDATRTALILSALFWCILLYPTNFDAAMTAKLKRVLGERPAGMDYDLFILLITFQLSVPMILFFRHLLITVTYAKKRRTTGRMVGIGALSGLFGYLQFLLRDTGEGPVIRRSKLITFCGILYVIGLAGWWIWWADSQGI